jgi:transposase
MICRMYVRGGLSLSEIERRTGLTRKTVRRRLKAAEGTEPKHGSPSPRVGQDVPACSR